MPLLSHALELRRKIAKLLGYKTWWVYFHTSYSQGPLTEDKGGLCHRTKDDQKWRQCFKGEYGGLGFHVLFFKHPQFLDDLEEKLRPVGIKDRDTLLAMKKKEHEALGLPFDGEFYIWDYRYYDRKYIEESLDLDDMLVKEYFPVSVVVPAILDIYQSLLGVQFVEIKDGKTWHPGTWPSP